VAAAVLALPALELPFFADDYLFLDFVRRHPLPGGLFMHDAIGNFVRPVSRALWFGTLGPLTGESSLAFHAANIVLVALVLLLFFRLARPFAGERGALAGMGFLALHYAFDVPVRWVSGSQDLLAVACALGALVVVADEPAARGGPRRFVAALLLGLGLLAKEVVAGTAPIALALAWARGEDRARAWRTTAPLFVVTALWALLWSSVRASSPVPGAALDASPSGALATVVHAVQVALGLEWGGGVPRLDPRAWIAIALVVGALLLAPRAAGAWRGPAARRVALAGALWALVAIAPLVPVAAIWSAYYYLFALAGMALALAAWAGARRPLVAAAVVAVLGLGSAYARGLDTFASRPLAWSSASHVNRHYVERGMSFVTSMLRDLRSVWPRPEPRTTFYFVNLPSFVGFHTADGPLVRWAYRDTSLRSDFLSNFTLDEADPRPWLFVLYDRGRLVEMREPNTLFMVGSSLVELEAYAGAEAAIRTSLEREPALGVLANSWLPILALARGDSARARAALVPPPPAGVDPFRVRLGAAERAAARADVLAAWARGDTLAGFERMLAWIARAPFDAALRAQSADLAIASSRAGATAMIESFAARTLAPEDPTAWRRWALILGARGRGTETLRAVERVRELAGPGAPPDSQLAAIEAQARGRLPGGAEFERELK
jgi:hypothetical protein